MPTAGQGEGLYVGFEIAHQRPLHKYVQGLPQGMGEKLDPASLTVVAMYPEELACYDLSRDERRTLPALVRKVSRRLSAMAIVGNTSLEPNQDHLVLHKNHVAIPVDPSDELAEGRQEISEIVFKAMGIKLPSYNREGWYVAVSRKRGRGKKIPPYHKPFPELALTGMQVAIRAPQDQFMGDVRGYVNTPRHVWRR